MGGSQKRFSNQLWIWKAHMWHAIRLLFWKLFHLFRKYIQSPSFLLEGSQFSAEITSSAGAEESHMEPSNSENKAGVPLNATSFPSPLEGESRCLHTNACTRMPYGRTDFLKSVRFLFNMVPIPPAVTHSVLEAAQFNLWLFIKDFCQTVLERAMNDIIMFLLHLARTPARSYRKADVRQKSFACDRTKREEEGGPWCLF